MGREKTICVYIYMYDECPESSIYKWYHSDRKYKDILVFMLMPNRSLHSRPGWHVRCVMYQLFTEWSEWGDPIDVAQWQQLSVAVHARWSADFFGCLSETTSTVYTTHRIAHSLSGITSSTEVSPNPGPGGCTHNQNGGLYVGNAFFHETRKIQVVVLELVWCTPCFTWE